MSGSATRVLDTVVSWLCVKNEEDDKWLKKCVVDVGDTGTPRSIMAMRRLDDLICGMVKAYRRCIACWINGEPVDGKMMFIAAKAIACTAVSYRHPQAREFKDVKTLLTMMLKASAPHDRQRFFFLTGSVANLTAQRLAVEAWGVGEYINSWMKGDTRDRSDIEVVTMCRGKLKRLWDMMKETYGSEVKVAFGLIEPEHMNRMKYICRWLYRALCHRVAAEMKLIENAHTVGLILKAVAIVEGIDQPRSIEQYASRVFLSRVMCAYGKYPENNPTSPLYLEDVE